MTEDDYTHAQISDPYALKLLADVKILVKQWRSQCSIENFEGLLDYFTQSFTEYIEYSLKNNPRGFNEFGILQFEKDLRELSTGLQSLANKPLRQRFSRLK